jgi:hypothetical protein
MNRRQWMALAALAGTALLAGGCASVPATLPTRIVFQVSDADPGCWNLVLNNVANAQKEVGADKAQIEIVAFGPGVAMLRKDSEVAGRVSTATQAGVQVVACQNSMRALHLGPPDMGESVGYVPAGVIEIAKRQQQGWAYIRP